MERLLSDDGLSGVLALPQLEFEGRLDAVKKDLKESIARSAFLNNLYRPGVTHSELLSM